MMRAEEIEAEEYVFDGEDSTLLLGRSRRARIGRTFFYGVILLVAFALSTITLRTTFPRYQKSSDPVDSSGDDTEEDSGVGKIILISIDGFRWDYLDFKDDDGNLLAPTLSAMREAGVSASKMQPVMPSKTFPNHWSLVTGLFPAWHGIIDNAMFDRAANRHFSIQDHKDPRWWQGEPIWSTANRQGLTSATVFWPGSEVKSSHFTSPTKFLDYDGSMRYAQRVDKVLQYLEGRGMPRGKPANLVTLYLNNVDKNGHEYGPNSEEVAKTIKEADAAVRLLQERIEARNGPTERTSIVVVSDHGMQEVLKADAIEADEHIDEDKLIIPALYPLGQFFSMDLNQSALYEVVKPINADGKVAVMKLEDTPESWHYKDSALSPPVVSLCEPGISLMFNSTLENMPDVWGEHGYSNTAENMQAIFLASGPHFPADGRVIHDFRAVDVYEVLCRALKLSPSPNNGSTSIVDQVFQ